MSNVDYSVLKNKWIVRDPIAIITRKKNFLGCAYFYITDFRKDKDDLTLIGYILNDNISDSQDYEIRTHEQDLFGFFKDGKWNWDDWIDRNIIKDQDEIYYLDNILKENKKNIIKTHPLKIKYISLKKPYDQA